MALFSLLTCLGLSSEVHQQALHQVHKQLPERENTTLHAILIQQIIETLYTTVEV